jgi:uncharacterized protein YdaU (DUF1376 family)
MQMAELPFFPIKTQALIADTRHMSAEEFGAYCRLLFTMWLHGGKIPNKPLELARIAGVAPQRWHFIAANVMRPMSVTPETVSQKRLLSTWLDVQERRRKRVEAAKKRWGVGRTMGHA